MTWYRKYEKDLEVCINRFVVFKKEAERWAKKGGGDMLIFSYLDINGNKVINLPPHPFKNSLMYGKKNGKIITKSVPYSDAEILAFIQCFGKPLIVPKNLLTSIGLKKFLNQVDKRKELMRECLGFTRNSRFRNFFNKIK